MDDRHKRLAAAKRKLQEYKNQKKQENVNDSFETSSRKSNEGGSVDTSKEDDNTEELEFSLSAGAESVKGDCSEESLVANSVANVLPVGNGLSCDAVENGQEQLTTSLTESSENIMEAGAEENPHMKFEKTEVTLNEAYTQCDEEVEIVQTQRDVLENLEKELSSLRKENSILTHRETELLLQLEASEKLIRDLRKEVNQFKLQGNVHQQLEELQEAVAVVTKSKMNLAEQLSDEQDKNQELLNNVGTFENELGSLRKENTTLWSDLNTVKAKLEEELMKNHVLDDQRRHFSNQVETLQKKLSSVEVGTTISQGHENVHNHSHYESTRSGNDEEQMVNGHNVNEGDCSHLDHQDHDHHDHSDHDGGHQDHDHDHCHTDSHHHDHDDVHAEGNKALVEMQKTLKRLEWENKTYEVELMKLSPLKNLEPKCEELQSKNAALKQEIDRLEHLVIQLQGENDTIGDYIQLYQTQRLALRQHAKENDELVEALSREKNELLHKLSELNQAVEKLASQPNASVLENKIRDLIVDVNTKVHEPYTCSVCSGSRLMTV